MNTIPFVIDHNDRITLLVQGHSYTVPPEHGNYDAILASLDASPEEILELLIERPPISHEDFTIDHGILYYKDQQIHGVLAEKIQELHTKQLPYTPLVRFLANCRNNPRPEAVNELYGFLAHGGFPITFDGCFLGYKSVRHDYLDHYSRKMNNAPGHTVTMPREDVTYDPDDGCGAGLHVGTLKYAQKFRHDAVILIVKVDPRDVVSVPHDCSQQKLRACKYEVVADYGSSTPMPEHVVDDVSKVKGAKVPEKAAPAVDFAKLKRRDLANYLVGQGMFPSQKAAEYLSKEMMTKFAAAGLPLYKELPVKDLIEITKRMGCQKKTKAPMVAFANQWYANNT